MIQNERIALIISPDSQILHAVSFDTATYHDLVCFVNEHSGYTLTRVDPIEFLSTHQPTTSAYINLVLKDIELRKQVTEHLDKNNYSRFSLIHDRCYVGSADIDPGCLIYPMASIYPTVKLQRDVIVHSLTLIAHQCSIGVGTYISGGTTIAGNTKIGDFSQINIDATIYDKVEITANTIIGAGTVVRKSITKSGTYSSQLKNKITKIK